MKSKVLLALFFLVLASLVCGRQLEKWKLTPGADYPSAVKCDGLTARPYLLKLNTMMDKEEILISFELWQNQVLPMK